MTEPDWLTVREVALRLRVSRMTVYRLVERGELVAYRVGRQLRIRSTNLAGYLVSIKTEA